MIAGNPNARAVQFFLDAERRAAQPDRRRPAPGGHRRHEAAQGGRRHPDRRHPGRRCRVRCDVRRREHLGPQDPLAGQPRRLARRWRRNCPRPPFDSIFPCAPTSRDCLPQPGIVEPRPVPRHPVLPPAADLAARVPQLQHLRVDRHQPVRRSHARRGRSALVRDPACRRAPTPSTSRAPTRRATVSTAGWARIAQDKNGNMALGYSVVNGTTCSPEFATRDGSPATRSAR